MHTVLTLDSNMYSSNHTEFSSVTPAILTEVFSGSHQSLQKNSSFKILSNSSDALPLDTDSVLKQEREKEKEFGAGRKVSSLKNEDYKIFDAISHEGQTSSVII